MLFRLNRHEVSGYRSQSRTLENSRLQAPLAGASTQKVSEVYGPACVFLIAALIVHLEKACVTWHLPWAAACQSLFQMQESSLTHTLDLR